MPLLFSYGTLRQRAVQLATFGRVLTGEPDALVGFTRSQRTIDDPAFVAESGKADHEMVTYDGNADSRVEGTVYEVTSAELLQSDTYEPAGYERISTVLASGRQAWVYGEVRG